MRSLLLLALLLLPVKATTPWSIYNINNTASYYIDSRDYSTIGFNTVGELPWENLDLWGFTEFRRKQNSDTGDVEDFFMEYRLLYGFTETWGVLTEYNNFNGSDNDLFRFGPYITKRFSLPWNRAWNRRWNKVGVVQLRVYPYDTRTDNGQLSLSYNIPFTDRLFLTGFIDYNIIEGGKDQWVFEPQLNYRFTDTLDILLEYRYNGYESDDPNLDGTGVAVGIKYRF